MIDTDFAEAGFASSFQGPLRVLGFPKPKELLIENSFSKIVTLTGLSQYSFITKKIRWKYVELSCKKLRITLKLFAGCVLFSLAQSNFLRQIFSSDSLDVSPQCEG